MPDTSLSEFILSKYRAVELLGKGGFGTVYRAIDTTLDREVALKVLHPQLVADPTFVERFRTEAKIIAALRHPNVVGVYELGEEGGRLFIAMEYMPGGTLKERLAQRGRLSFDETLAIMQQVCAGLDAAHAKGMIHRDIKPANILFGADGQAVVSDFGLARAVQLASTRALSSSTGGVGTPFYKAPELWNGQPPASAATDVYALACMTYEMLIGRVLFDGDTPDVIITKHLVNGPVFGSDWPPTDAPKGLNEVIQHGLARNPEGRFASAKALADALSELTVTTKRKTVTVAASPAIQPTQNRTVAKTPLEVIIGFMGLIGVVLVIASLASRNIFAPTPPPTSSITPTNTISSTATSTTAPTLTADPTTAPIPSFTETPAPTASPIPTVTPQPTNTPEPTAMPTRVLPTATPTLGIGSTQVAIDGMTLLYIPAGEFTMGNNDGDADEKPEHKVYLDAFWIDQTEVTNGMYAKCVKAGCQVPIPTKSSTRASYYGNAAFDNYPVIYISWSDAQTYCEWAGRSLPTEAQWERAVRGTNQRAYPWGNEAPSDNRSNFNRNVGDTTEVGQYLVGISQYGALDMAGNVWEWMKDWYDGKYYASLPTRNPTGPSSGSVRALRGGSWFDSGAEVRSSSRGHISPDLRSDNVGFRCVLPAQ